MSASTSSSKPASKGAVSSSGFVHRYANSDSVLRFPALELQAGECVACIGPSGSGKSTLLSLIAGILLPEAGAVQFEGQTWQSLSEAGRRKLRIRRIGLVFQEFELLDHLSVRENILLPYFVSGALSLDAAVKERVDELARSAGIERLLNRGSRELSMGERQRVAICRAMVTEPALILADEPTGNLDPDSSRRVLDLLLGQVRAAGSTLLTVTHDHSLLDSFDRVIDLAELVEVGR